MAGEIVQIGLVVVAVVLAILTVEFQSLLYASLCFGGMCVCLGGLYWTLSAPYAALFQMLIYGGAVIVLFISVVMLTRGVEDE